MLGPLISFIATNALAENVTKDLKREGYLLGKSLPEGCQGVEQEKAARKELKMRHLPAVRGLPPRPLPHSSKHGTKTQIVA